MKMRLWLMLLLAMLAVWNAGITWFTQIAVYPLWPLVGAQYFHDYHLTWWHDMWPAFGPVALMLLCSFALVRYRPRGVPRWTVWLGIAMQVVVHALTIAYWAPIQASMATSTGMSDVKYQQLMATHWWRVGFFWAFAALSIWMLARTVNARIGNSENT